MSHITPGKLRPVSMPRDARPIMKFSGELADAIEQQLRDATDGRWDKPVDVKLDPRNPESLAHWLYKSMHPVIKGMRRSDVDIETLLEPYKRTRFDMLPEDFSIEAEITMSASGDLLCTPGLDGAKDRLFQSVDDLIFGVDISYANLESTLTTEEVEPTEFTAESTPKINLTPSQYETVISHKNRRFDVVHLANNHILDCGEEGILTTLARLDRDGIAQVGVNRTEDDARKPRITEIAGLKVGWVAHTFSVNFKPFPEDKPWIVNMTPFHLEPEPDISLIERQIQACRDEDCEIVVVALHWGLEFELYPHPQQVRWAHRFAELGADLVIGHHPHVPQPVEIYRPASDPDRAVPILYSLGNLSTLLSHPAMALSLVARIGFAKGLYRGRPTALIATLNLIPVALVAEESGGKEIIRLVPLKELDSSVSEGPMRAYVDEMIDYAEVVVGDDWRTDVAV
ncbi:CapA family protein [Sphingorhabdus sp.]|uniref:CapA family protein n=1 Tax=Sphingorhabdus sp. TaxID=1902408 RepID=UPI0037C6B659